MNELIKSSVKQMLHLLTWPLVQSFHIIWYHSNATWMKNKFLGLPIGQCPLDLQLYQEIIHSTKPDVIIQTGVARGGSILFFASMLDIISAASEALVIGIDIKLEPEALSIKHPRVRLIEGSSTDPEVVATVKSMTPAGGGMVILDSDHSCRHVLAELQIYSSFVAPGKYLVAEDTNVGGHPVCPFHGSGPLDAVKLFLKSQPCFIQDNAIWRRNMFSFHQYGWLRKKESYDY